MSLHAGTRLGPYEIEAPIGAGGMGEVYRAKDTRLDRTVAIKVLPSELSTKPGLRQRFEREARAIASLNHPHICALHDVGQQDGVDFLVMEYLEGETLADRLSHGPLKTEQLLRHAIQMADALDKAHRKGFVHRDLKPANIMLTQAGVKLLDFGLAQFEEKVPSGEDIAGTAATLTRQPLTAEGTIVGTMPYMAPEQLEGKETDARTDVFAFGAILYEMATGKRAFEGKSQASLIAAILAAEPKPMRSLQPLAPPALERVVQTCLAKDPEERWQNAHDIMRQLEWIAEPKTQPEDTAQQRRLGRERLSWACLVGLLSIALAILAARHFREVQPERQQIRFSFQTADRVLGPLSMSPDGRYLAVVGEKSQLPVRPLSSLGTQSLPGTEGAHYPFWSRDSRFIGFFAEGKLKKIAVTGGPAQTLCDAAEGRGGTWNREGTIVFSPNPTDVLYSVPSAGGVPKPATAKVTAAAAEKHRYPHFLPDGRHFLFLVSSAAKGNNGIYVASLDSKQPRRLLPNESNAEYVPPSLSEQQGYLLFAEGNTLAAQPFDPSRLQTTGEAFPVAEQVSPTGDIGYFGFSTSRNGVVAYSTRSLWASELLWFDREGKRLGTVGKPGTYGSVSLSPDEKGVAATHFSLTGPSDIWIHDLTRSSVSRFTFGPSISSTPVWSSDGSHIAFSSVREGSSFIYQRDVSGSGKEELLLQTKFVYRPTVLDWSHDGRFIVYEDFDAKTKSDLWLLPADHRPEPLLQTEFNETQGQLSPDGRWVAYTSDESGFEQIYVQSFRGPGGKSLISSSGGWQPRWRGDGKELFYIAADRKLMVVANLTSSKSSHFEASDPKPLFQTAILGIDVNVYFFYDVTADGRRFLINTLPGEGTQSAINVVVNWQAGLK
jgi:eukaryotic-like serine/threonine-protein kinase